MMARSRKHDTSDGWSKLTDLAFALLIGIVLARGMMLETIRDAFGVVPGQEIVLRSPNAATTAILDLLTYLPAMVIAGRCVFDERWRARRSWSALTLAAIGVLALTSVMWSPDRFAAAVSAGKLLAGSAVLWATVQWVRDWGRFRVICGLLAGLVAVNLLHSVLYVYVDLPDTQRIWAETRETKLKQQGLEPGSFAAKQFEQKIMGSEVMAFCASPNSLAAIIAMLAVLLLAGIAQRSRDGQAMGWSILPMLLIAGGGWIIWRAGSKTAMTTPILGLVLLVMGWNLRGWMSRRRVLAFSAGVGVFVLAWAAVIGHGLHHGTLFQRSLTFRWHYWTASLRMFLDHSLAGVGWENFGRYYTQYRLPIAPEEISDPHNLFVRFGVELGIGGLLLAIGWVAAVFWEATTPATREIDSEPADEIGPGWLIMTAAAATAIACFAGVDLTQEGSIIEVLRRSVYGIVMLGTAVAVTTADFGQVRIRQSTAPILLAGLAVAVAVFFIHSMIDFALFETGPFYLVITAAGALIGMRLSLGQPSPRNALPAVAAISLALIATGIIIVAPVVVSENSSRIADDSIAAGRLSEAKAKFQQAFTESAWLKNADDLLRRSVAQTWAHDPPADIRRTLDAAIAANPRSVRTILARARLAIETGDATRAADDLRRAISLDPWDVGLRIEAADGFAKLNNRPAAIEQYEKAIQLNEALPPDEPKRRPPEKIAELRATLKTLSVE